MSESEVIIIEPTKSKQELHRKYNVAAYARVSTGSSEQKDSFDNQKKYYEAIIKNNPAYNFVGIFADEAISGTTDKRPQFQRMIRLAEHKKIDIIYTKSISRFSRNVADLLNYCKLLKKHGVNLIFEENGIELLNTTGTLMLTILGAVAQMEVENTSDHVNWTLQKKMEKGELVGYATPLGYDNMNGKLVVNEEEAKTVRYIFKRYLQGAGATIISRELEKIGAKTKRNGTSWSVGAVMNIIKNEKYTGTLLQGKSYTVDPISHERKSNRGEVKSYLRNNDHEAIISLVDWDKAQKIIASRSVSHADGRKRGTTQNSKQNVFTSKIVCAYCGKNYVRRKTHPGTKYEKIIWDCSTAIKSGKASCPKCKAIEEDTIKQAVVGMIQDLIKNDDNCIFYLTNEKLSELLKQSERNKDRLHEKIEQYQKGLDSKNKKKSRLIEMRSDDVITAEDFTARIARVNEEINSIQELLDELTSDIEYEDEKSKNSTQICKLISEGKAEGFNEELFNLLVNKIRVGGLRYEDHVDDPKSLHVELNTYNLDTDMRSKVEDGVLRYTMDFDDMEEAVAEEVKKNNLKLYSSHINNVLCLYSVNQKSGLILKNIEHQMYFYIDLHSEILYN